MWTSIAHFVGTFAEICAQRHIPVLCACNANSRGNWNAIAAHDARIRAHKHTHTKWAKKEKDQWRWLRRELCKTRTKWVERDALWLDAAHRHDTWKAFTFMRSKRQLRPEWVAFFNYVMRSALLRPYAIPCHSWFQMGRKRIQLKSIASKSVWDQFPRIGGNPNSIQKGRMCWPVHSKQCEWHSNFQTARITNSNVSDFKCTCTEIISISECKWLQLCLMLD